MLIRKRIYIIGHSQKLIYAPLTYLFLLLAEVQAVVHAVEIIDMTNQCAAISTCTPNFQLKKIQNHVKFSIIPYRIEYPGGSI